MAKLTDFAKPKMPIKKSVFNFKKRKVLAKMPKTPDTSFGKKIKMPVPPVEPLDEAE